MRARRSDPGATGDLDGDRPRSLVNHFLSDRPGILHPSSERACTRDSRLLPGHRRSSTLRLRAASEGRMNGVDRHRPVRWKKSRYSCNAGPPWNVLLVMADD